MSDKLETNLIGKRVRPKDAPSRGCFETVVAVYVTSTGLALGTINDYGDTTTRLFLNVVVDT